MNRRLYLSPPHMSGLEHEFVRQAFESNYIAPLGPQVDAFEEEFAEKLGAKYAVALSSGTAAIHLSLVHLGIKQGDRVIVSDLTFVASANPVLYQRATPVFIDSESSSWNMDPELLENALDRMARTGTLPKAVILVHLYGQSAHIDRILAVCNKYEVPLIEDAAEALGASYRGASPGTFGLTGVFSFNGNKIITTSGGGMLVTNDEELANHIRKLSTQAREPVPHYEHTEVGYNYRMSNVLAAIGRGQLRVLDQRVEKKRKIFQKYLELLGDLPGIEFMPEAHWGTHSRWLTVITVDSEKFGANKEEIRQALEAQNIESRPLWKPMHLQPLFSNCEFVGTDISENLFKKGLCLPSGTAMEDKDIYRVVDVISSCHRVK